MNSCVRSLFEATSDTFKDLLDVEFLGRRNGMTCKHFVVIANQNGYFSLRIQLVVIWAVFVFVRKDERYILGLTCRSD